MFAAILAMALVAPQDRGGAILIDRNRIDHPAPAPLPPSQPPALAPKVASGNPNMTITGINFDGTQAPAPVARAARRFLGRKASIETLQKLAAALSKAYGRSAVALYTVSIPQQDFANGVVRVRLVEGSIAHAAIKGRANKHPLLAARMAPLLDEKPLRRATLERQFTLMRSIPGLTIKPQLTDPQGTGALDLTVTPEQKRTKFTFGYSNRGLDLLGDGELDAGAHFYGLGIDGDELSLTGSAAPDFKRFRYGAASYSAPLTASGLTLSESAAYLETRPRDVPLIGRAKFAGATLSYPVLRSFHRSADVSIGIDGLNSDNAAFGNLIASERTRAVRLSASYADARVRHVFSISGSVSRGLDVLGARVTQPLADPQFTKVAATAKVDQAIGKRATVRLMATGTYSADRLPAAERFTAGGETLGRAFDTALLSGDRGAGGSAELAYRPLKSKAFGQSEVYAFADGAVLGVLPRGPGAVRQDYALASAGVGLRARYTDKAMLGLEAARPIRDPYPGYDEKWRLIVEWSLSL